MDQIFYLDQSIHLVVEWNTKGLHKINIKLDEMTKVVQGLINKKMVVTNTFSRKLQNTTKEFDLDNFETTSRFLIP